MKRIMTLLITLMSAVPAFAAVNANSSWEEIMRDRYAIVKAPTIYMGRAIDYTFACQDGDRLRTQKPVDTTVSRTRGDREEIIVIDRDYLSTPINYTHEVENCFWNNNQRRCKMETVTGSYPLTVNIPVYKRISNRNVERYELLFRKSYTVPQCDTPTVD
ncbi:hypothetical protein [Bdellovibrio bacteriovorus]|uniref:hypothetical protein n=1 Tax=Bdellovibrio bacteriovorus TaxID=959 RepID=UPI0035A6498C